MALTRDAVVDTAVRLLGEEGLAALTLRRLARELGVSAPTLYWHVADKRTLLDHVATRLLADQWTRSSPEGGQPWWVWLRERSLAQYRVLVDHRDAALVVAGNRPTAASLPAAEDVLATLVRAGFTPADAFGSVIAVGNYVIGSAVEYQAERARPDHDGEMTTDPYARPHLAAVAEALAAGDADHETVFLHGLDLMIAGMRSRCPPSDPGRSSSGAQGSPIAVAATSATWSK